MKVRIFAAPPSSWYVSKIGQEFEVEEKNGVYAIVSDLDKYKFFRYIEMCDAEIVLEKK